MLAEQHTGKERQRIGAEGRHQHDQQHTAAVGQHPQTHQAAQRRRDGNARHQNGGKVEEGDGAGLSVFHHHADEQQHNESRQQPFYQHGKLDLFLNTGKGGQQNHANPHNSGEAKPAISLLLATHGRNQLMSRNDAQGEQKRSCCPYRCPQHHKQQQRNAHNGYQNSL